MRGPGRRGNLRSKIRAVITGLGPLAANGVGVANYWRSLVDGRSGIGPITLFDTSQHDTKIAGEVKSFSLADYIKPHTNPRKLSRQTQLALAATKLAMDDAGLSNGSFKDRAHVPVMIGISTSSYSMIEAGMQQMMERGPSRVPTFIISGSQPQQAGSTIASEFGFSSVVHTFSSACPSGLDAVWAACQWIYSGKGEIALAGGSDAPISPLGMACLDKAGLVTANQADPPRASRPFSSGTDSGVMSEGSAMMFVESFEHAMARGAKMYFEVTGYASCIDPDPNNPASGLTETMRMALNNAGRRPEDIDFICAHGPGHPILDRAETRMIKEVFGAHAYKVPITSIKGVTGNPLSAAGPLQLAACGCAIRNGLIPPTANLETPDALCDLDYVPMRARHCEIDRILINTHGLGGGNSSMVVERVTLE